MHDNLNRICEREDLSSEEIGLLFQKLVEGELEEIHIAALLVGLRTKGETPEEIAGAASALRQHALEFPKPVGSFIDVCGTGGDGSGTINISTATAIVLAELGIPVAKHGNRSVSSKCGSADILEAWGVKLDPEPAVARKCLDEANICFLFAPQYHGGLRYAMPVRKCLKMRTLFNVLGPLVNPAHPTHQLMGVYDPNLVVPMAETLARLGVERALVVHGQGLDEISVSGPTIAALAEGGEIRELELTPEMAGLSRYAVEELAGGNAEVNRAALDALFRGEGAAAHEAAVAINAGAAAWIAGIASDMKAGAEMAVKAMRSGKIPGRIQRWAELSHGA